MLTLADAAIRIEDHYSRKAGQPTPMDIEWAKDGVDGQLYIVQARPETVASQRTLGVRRRVPPRRKTARARCAPPAAPSARKVASGKARVISDVTQLGQFQPGEVLVADTTMPDWGTVMKRRPRRSSPTAAGAPAMPRSSRVNSAFRRSSAATATTAIRTGDEVTVSCAEGEVGRVYAGTVPVRPRRAPMSRRWPARARR